MSLLAHCQGVGRGANTSVIATTRTRPPRRTRRRSGSCRSTTRPTGPCGRRTARRTGRTWARSSPPSRATTADGRIASARSVGTQVGASGGARVSSAAAGRRARLERVKRDEAKAARVARLGVAHDLGGGDDQAEGGEGVIVQVGSKLFIRQSSEIHQAIIDFIRELKFADAMTMEAVSSRLSLISTWLISFNRDSIPATVLDSVTYMLFSNSRIVLASLHA